MTYLDLTTLHYLKVQKKAPLDSAKLTDLVYIVAAVKRQPKRIWDIIQNDSKTIMMNVSKLSKKYKYLQQLIIDIKTKFQFSDLEIVAFVCWYTFNYIDLKSFQKNSLDKISDEMLNQFKEWYKALNANVHIVYGFKKSCQTILNMRKKNGESGIDCLNRLIQQDKLSELYYTGGISAYFLAAIPKRKIHIPKSAIFSNKLFSLVDENKEMLISKLNFASKHYLKVPIDSIAYLNALQHVNN
jgi:hypothetical protein